MDQYRHWFQHFHNIRRECNPLKLLFAPPQPSKTLEIYFLMWSESLNSTPVLVSQYILLDRTSIWENNMWTHDSFNMTTNSIHLTVIVYFLQSLQYFFKFWLVAPPLPKCMPNRVESVVLHAVLNVYIKWKNQLNI